MWNLHQGLAAAKADVDHWRWVDRVWRVGVRVLGQAAQAVIDPRPWVGQGLGRQATAHLETRLRCVCGARRARLEIRGLSEAPTGGAGGIYVFR